VEQKDHDMHEDHVERLHPEHNEYSDCKYTGEWGDCDPFKMIKYKEMRLLTGGSHCEEKKNITKPCSREDFPPGTVWLLKEHKLCVMELQKLKSMIEDLHRYIDLIHQRGQALFNAYNELRKRLMDVRREISVISRRNHDAEQTIKRLRTEMEDWKQKSNKMQMELNELKAQYKEMENKVEAAKEKNTILTSQKEEASSKQIRLNAKLDDLTTENRNLKSALLEAERYREEFREIAEIIGLFKKKISDVNNDIKRTKEDLQKARMEGAMPKSKKKPPKFDKDTKVNLDMSMWIVHNYTKEEQEEFKPQVEIQYVEPYHPPAYEPQEYHPPAYEPEEPKYEAPKYEAPKYEAPTEAYAESTYPESTYAETTAYAETTTGYYEETTHEEYHEPTKYEEPPASYEPPKEEDAPTYEPPKYEEPEPEEDKY